MKYQVDDGFFGAVAQPGRVLDWQVSPTRRCATGYDPWSRTTKDARLSAVSHTGTGRDGVAVSIQMVLCLGHGSVSLPVLTPCLALPHRFSHYALLPSHAYDSLLYEWEHRGPSDGAPLMGPLVMGVVRGSWGSTEQRTRRGWVGGYRDLTASPELMGPVPCGSGVGLRNTTSTRSPAAIRSSSTVPSGGPSTPSWNAR